MARLIDADELRSEMQEYVFPITTNNLMGAADAYYRILHLLEDAPTVDPTPVVHGEWEDYPSNLYKRCSVCKMEYDKLRNNFVGKYCPNCGSKMDGGKKDAGY